ncbi:MAG: hypothetical protein AABZ23_01620 [Deltaproteobacteria bacterium]
MDREIRVRITRDGRVEIDSSVFKDCKDVAEQLTKELGKVESFVEKDHLDKEVRLKIEGR